MDMEGEGEETGEGLTMEGTAVKRPKLEHTTTAVVTTIEPKGSTSGATPDKVIRLKRTTRTT